MVARCSVARVSRPLSVVRVARPTFELITATWKELAADDKLAPKGAGSGSRDPFKKLLRSKLHKIGNLHVNCQFILFFTNDSTRKKQKIHTKSITGNNITDLFAFIHSVVYYLFHL